MTSLNVHQRLAAAMNVVKYIQSVRKPNMHYNTVSHDSVTSKVRPALLDNGIVYYPVRCEHSHNGNRAECSMTVRFVNVDEPQDFFDVQSFGYGVDGQDKGPGKAMSYAVKYALLKALGLETGEDADDESVDHVSESQQKAAEQSAQAVAVAISRLTQAPTLEALQTVWTTIGRDIQHDPTVIAAKDKMKASLSKPVEDEIPY